MVAWAASRVVAMRGTVAEPMAKVAEPMAKVAAATAVAVTAGGNYN